jgi:hypothetical protein
MDDIIHPEDFLSQARHWREAATKRTASKWSDIYLSLAEAYEQAAEQARNGGPPMFPNAKSARIMPPAHASARPEHRFDRPSKSTIPPLGWPG